VHLVVAIANLDGISILRERVGVLRDAREGGYWKYVEDITNPK